MTQKPTKSPALTAINQHLDEQYERFAEHMDKALADLPAFPHGRRGAVYCWLWDNHEEVLHALGVHWLTWGEVAATAAKDGVTGRWDKPPTGNAMRRVWGRVCPDMERRNVAKAQVPGSRRFPSP